MQWILTCSLVSIFVVPAARSDEMECTSEDQQCHPEQIHLAFTETPNVMIVTWSTLKDTKHTVIQFRPAGKSNQLKVEGTRQLFEDGGPKKLKQTIHRAVMEDLEYNTTYEYQVGSNYGMSETFTFTTVPEGDHWQVRALIFGDLGVSNGISTPFLIDDASNNHYDVAFHVGDLAYDLDKDDGDRGNQFMNQMQPLAAKVPYMVCPGNHEAAYNFSHYRNRFSMPLYQQFESYFYSFNLGPVHFVSVNTEAYYNDDQYPAGLPTSSETMRIQYEWLEKDLKKANEPDNRAARPWIVLYGHRPMLCSNSMAADQCRDHEYPHRIGIPDMGGYGLEVLLKDYGVDVAIWAHEHSYERMWPVYNKTVYNGSLEQPYVNPRAPVHITSGCAGNQEGTDGFYSDPYSWSAYRSSAYGYTRLHVFNGSHIYFEQLSTQAALHDSGITELETIDSFWVVKDLHKAYDL